MTAFLSSDASDYEHEPRRTLARWLFEHSVPKLRADLEAPVAEREEGDDAARYDEEDLRIARKKFTEWKGAELQLQRCSTCGVLFTHEDMVSHLANLYSGCP